MLTILSMKDLDRYIASIVSSSIGETINMHSLNLAKCQYWLTDNTAYMFGSKGGAVVEFNKLYSAKAIRILCGLHVLHITKDGPIITFKFYLSCNLIVPLINSIAP